LSRKQSAAPRLVEAQTRAIVRRLAFAGGAAVVAKKFYRFFNFPHPRRTQSTASGQAIVI
jgi:hypothetical protein